jgi:hypothetical protein
VAKFVVHLIGCESLALNMVIFFKRKFDTQKVVESLEELLYKD